MTTNRTVTAINDICRYIDRATDRSVSVQALARRSGMSVFHFQRCFKQVIGVTPGSYLQAKRVSRLKKSLRRSRNVTEAIYDVGFGSPSRAYERAGARLGMTPKQYRQGGAGVPITFGTMSTAFGLVMVGATDRGLCFVHFGETADELVALLQDEYPAAQLQPMSEPHHEDFDKWVDGLRNHLSGRQPHAALPLDVRATAFQMRVWNYLRSIPYGEVQSYGEVAAGLGQPTAVRAVAAACARNRVALVIPCHRVIRGTGELGGYRWGLARKRALIEHERRSRKS
jgi:AraC family transcriptional regulator of adaptative response/methylated-DNA-[protein]-cysteine methyltransferase